MPDSSSRGAPWLGLLAATFMGCLIALSGVTPGEWFAWLAITGAIGLLARGIGKRLT